MFCNVKTLSQNVKLVIYVVSLKLNKISPTPTCKVKKNKALEW